MALIDWITNTNYPLALIATSATVFSNERNSVAKVANVAAIGNDNANNQFSFNEAEDLAIFDELLKLYPPVVHGCKLTDILSHAEVMDYPDLKNATILENFVKSLIEDGLITPKLA